MTTNEALEAAQEQARRRMAEQQREREMGAPRICGSCNGTGYAEVDVADGVGYTVQRCRCQPSPPEKHRPRCPCFSCFYREAPTDSATSPERARERIGAIRGDEDF